MRFSKPFTAGLVLAILIVVSHGRAILPTDHIVDKEVKIRASDNTIPPEVATDVGFDICQVDLDRIECTRERKLNFVKSHNSKRAPPKITRPGREGENSPQDGSGTQTGSGQEGGGAQSGGDRQDGGGTPGAPPPVADPIPVPATPATPPVHPAYADLPDDFNVPGRVPGQDVLPNEIPAFRGLDTGADDAARRASFRRFLNCDIQSSNKVQPGSHFLLYLGTVAKEARQPFKNGFNLERKHKEFLDPNDQSPLVDNTNVYTGIRTGDDLVSVPPGSNSDIWLSILKSYGIAKRAAARGGTVRILVDAKPDKSVNKDRLSQEGSFFHNFELGVVTGPGSNVERIIAYGARGIPDPQNPGKTLLGEFTFSPPEEIWRAGQPQIGKTPDFAEGTLPQEQRTKLDESDDDSDLIDLGDFKRRFK